MGHVAAMLVLGERRGAAPRRARRQRPIDPQAKVLATAEGQAVVLRSEPGSEMEKELAVLGEGAFFGECVRRI